MVTSARSMLWRTIWQMSLIYKLRAEEVLNSIPQETMHWTAAQNVIQTPTNTYIQHTHWTISFKTNYHVSFLFDGLVHSYPNPLIIRFWIGVSHYHGNKYINISIIYRSGKHLTWPAGSKLILCGMSNFLIMKVPNMWVRKV